MTEPRVYMFLEGNIASQARGLLANATAERIQYYRSDKKVLYYELNEGLAAGITAGIEIAQQEETPTLLVYVTDALVSPDERHEIEAQIRNLNTQTMMVWVIIPSEPLPREWLERLDMSFPRPKQTVIVYPGEDIPFTFSFKVDLFFHALD